MLTCSTCGGDSWDNHAACEQTKRPPRWSALAEREKLHDYDSIPRHQEQEAISRANQRNAWREAF